jgi:nitrogen fixation/metabolism regulation signal transduction histidine kinase
MVFRRFRINCTVRILLLSATIGLFFYLYFASRFYATLVICGVAIIIQVYSLISYVESSNRKLTRFLQSIRFSDFSEGFSGGVKGASFDGLNEALSNVSARFREISAEKEENYRYLQTVVQHVGVGMIAYRKDGGVELLNSAAKQLFDISHLKNIDALEGVSSDLLEKLRNIEPGQRDLVKISRGSELMQLSIYATELRLRHKGVMLVSFQNISSELDEKEMEAWQNLIRVLTHEIKNSLTPIASLAASIEEMIAPEGERETPVFDEDIEDIRGALQTIQKRSHGLLQFVDAYRNLTHIPKPEFKEFTVSELCGRVEKLARSQIDEKGIKYRCTIEPDSLEITADPQLVEQVLINILLNAIEATEGRPGARIDVEAGMDERGRTSISVTDNGPGILGDVIEKIFVPFYSTKAGGSGIGLSLSRQIMRMHRGDLLVQSEPDKMTTFTIRF